MIKFKYEVGEVFRKTGLRDPSYCITVIIIERQKYKDDNIYVVKDPYHGPIMYINEESLEELYEPI